MFITTSPVPKILNKALDGSFISRKDAEILLTEDDPKTHREILRAADELRRHLVGETVTYVVNLNLNFTNVCVADCTFCGFKRNLGQTDAYIVGWPEVLDKIDDAVRNYDATEVCIQGGLYPKVYKHYADIYPEQKNLLEFYGRFLEKVKERYPKIHIHAFSPEEISFVSHWSKTATEESLKYLKEKGLDSLPGTAAEILVDEVREKICPDKVDTRDWIRIIREAHGLGIPSTSTILFGHIETPAHVAEHMEILRGLQLETRGFTELVPLPFIHEKTQMAGLIQPASRSNIYRHYAVFRLFLGESIKNLQTSWVKLGKYDALETLRYGCNDYGGTLMEEKISNAAGSAYGTHLATAEIRSLIEKSGKIAKRRDTLYQILEEN